MCIHPCIHHLPLIDCAQQYFVAQAFLNEPRLPRERAFIKCSVLCRDDSRVCWGRGAMRDAHDIAYFKESGVDLFDLVTGFRGEYATIQIGIPFLRVLAATIVGTLALLGASSQEKSFGWPE